MIFRHLAIGHRQEKQHSKRGRKFTFHGSFKNKTDAVNKERSIPGAFILERGNKHVVVTENR